MSGLSIELINVATSLVTMTAIVLGIYMALLYLRNNRLSIIAEQKRFNRDAQFEQSNSHDVGGYVFFDVPDGFKSIFHDGMKGFEQFAALKGYHISMSVDTSASGRVGIRFILDDVGVTVSTDQVRRDVSEYIQKIRSGDNFDDMPVVADPIEHEQMLAAFRMRMSYLRNEAEIQKIKADAYAAIFEQAKLMMAGSISHRDAPSIILNVDSNGGVGSMGDIYSVSHSPGAAVGVGNELRIEGSLLKVGASPEDLNSQAAILRELVVLVKETGEVDGNDKEELVRNLENAREELEGSAEPGLIFRWLNRVAGVAKTMRRGGELFGKLKEAFDAFGVVIG